MRHTGRAARVALACAAVGWLAACGGGSSSGSGPSAPLVVPGIWTVIGSSTPAGAGATPDHGWVDLLQGAYAARGVTVVNLAMGGSLSYQGVPTATPLTAGRPGPDPVHNIDAALARTPVLVVVSYPSNDEAAGYAAEETVANILAIRAGAVAQGVSVAVTSSQPRRAAPTAQQAAVAEQVDRRLADAFGACFVDVRSTLATPDDTLDPRYDSGDGQHLNDAGHAVVFERLQAMLGSGRCVRVA